jgi:N utilization substance protein B
MTKPLESRRGQGRLSAMRFLYEWSLNPGESLDQAMEHHFKYMRLRTGVAVYARRLVEGTLSHLKQIDQMISDHLTNWSIDRLAVVDLTALRVGTFEMMYIEEVPTRVTINELVEVAKNYGSADSAGFVNGVLDAIRKNLEPSGEPVAHIDYVEAAIGEA